MHLAGREPKDNLHFVATNLRRVPQRVYEAVHCQRAHIENHIKELRYGLAIDRTSCTSFWANQLLVPPSRKMGQAIRNHFDARDMDEKHVRERFGVSSANLPTYLALVGNRTRGIAGVQPIGAKMTAKLVEGYGNLENILAAAAELPGSTQHALVDAEADARLSLNLVKLRTYVTVGLRLSEFRCADQSKTADSARR